MDVRKYLDYAVTALLYSAAGLTGLVANIIYKEYKRLQDDSARSQLESSNGGLVLIGLNTKKIIQPSRTGASSGAGRDVSLVNCVVDSDFWRRVKDSIYRIIAQLYTGKTAIQRATEQLAVDQARALTRVSPQNLQFEDEVPGKRYLHDESTINALSGIDREVRGDVECREVYEEVIKSEGERAAHLTALQVYDSEEWNTSTTVLVEQYLVGLQWIVDLAVNVEAELAKEVSQEADSDGPVSLILMESWTSLMPQTEYPDRLGKHWSDIGFQGKDPVTDLRAMGHLGLSSVHYFSCTYPKWARSVITRANHPKHWYPFAITLIQITSFLYSRLQDGTLNATLMSLIEANDSDDADEDFKQPVQCVAFFDTCCYMADLFDRNWTFGKHTNVMEHPRVMRETEEAILSTVRGEKIMARFLPVRQFTRGLE